MLAKFPTEIAGMTEETKDRQLLRLGVIAEFDAIDLYEQLAAAANDKKLKAVFLDIAREEKTHMGEFMALLLQTDKEQAHELESGKSEIQEKFG